MLRKGKLKNWVKSEFDETVFCQNADKIRKNNLKFYVLFNYIMIILMTVLYISTFFSEYAVSLKSTYVFFIAVSFIELLIYYLGALTNTIWAIYASYFGVAKAYIFCLLTSVVYNRNDNAVTFLVFLIIIPVCFLFKLKILYLIQTIAVISFCTLTVILKPISIASTDIFNCLLFFTISILIARQICNLRIDNICMVELEHNRSISMQNQRDLLSVALKSANMCAWEYDSSKKTLTPTYTPENYSGFSIERNNLPESVIFEELVESESINAIKDIYKMAYEGKRNIQGDIKIRAEKNDVYRWFHISMIAAKGQNDKITKYIGTSEDITDRKNLELQYQEQLKILDSANDGNLITKGRWNLTKNCQEKKLINSQTGLQLLEKDTYDNAKKILIDAIFPEKKSNEISEILDRNRLIEEYRNGIGRYDFEYQRITTMNSAIWVNLQVRICQAPGSDDIVCFAFSYDITEEVFNKNIVNRLVSLEYDFLGTVDIKTKKSIVHSMRNQVKEIVNSVGAYLSPVNYDETSVKVVNMSVIPEDAEEVVNKVKLSNILNYLEEHTTYMILFTANENGNLRRKKLEYSYLNSDREALIYYRSDVTDMYTQEQEQLAKVREALKQVEDANAAKTDFLSRMSHDIRTPMNAIIGMTHLAKKEERIDIVREYLENISTSSDFLLGLINDILDLSKIESGELQLKLEPSRVEEFENSVNNIIRPMMEKKKLEFVFAMDCGAKCLLIDKLRFKQIFFNLLTNAIKFTPEGGKVEFLAEHISPKDGKYGARYIVRDNGIGMSKDYIPHMFEAFSQENSARGNYVTGTGLGLPIVKSLIDAMGGSIAVKSEQGKGTEYTIDLYCEKVDIENEEIGEEEEDISLKGTQILLVEDNSMNIMVAKRLLEREGCIVSIANNGKEAIDIFSSSEIGFYDVVLMDVRMPVMDGITATENIRKLNRDDAKSVAIIAMTADAFAEEQKRTIAAGMNYHLSKPINPKIMFSVIKEFIKK